MAGDGEEDSQIRAAMQRKVKDKMANNPQEESTVDTQLSQAKKALGTHNGTRPSQNPQPDWAEIERAVNGDLRK
jgi:hypothetical protein